MYARFQRTPKREVTMLNVMRPGAKVRPKTLPLFPSHAPALTENKKLTIKLMGGEFIIFEEVNGVFKKDDFKLVSTATPEEPKAAATNGTPPKNLSAKRKSVKKRFERQTGRECTWKGGKLRFLESDEEVPDAPFLPKYREPVSPRSRRTSLAGY